MEPKLSREGEAMEAFSNLIQEILFIDLDAGQGYSAPVEECLDAVSEFVNEDCSKLLMKHFEKALKDNNWRAFLVYVAQVAWQVRGIAPVAFFEEV